MKKLFNAIKQMFCKHPKEFRICETSRNENVHFYCRKCGGSYGVPRTKIIVSSKPPAEDKNKESIADSFGLCKVTECFADALNGKHHCQKHVMERTFKGIDKDSIVDSVHGLPWFDDEDTEIPPIEERLRARVKERKARLEEAKKKTNKPFVSDATMKYLYCLTFLAIAFDIHYLDNSVPAYAPLAMGILLFLEIVIDKIVIKLDKYLVAKLDEEEGKK